MQQQNIFVVGLMAVGKSTVGRLLAERLGMPFYDSDQEIERRAGAEVAWIFDVEGERGFRDREEHVIDELTQLQGVVVATGGGVVKRPANRNRLASRGVVVHLDCPIKKLLARTRKDRKRPLLQGDDRESVLSKLMCERAPLYADIADYRFVSNEQSAKSLVQQIERRLRADGLVS
jgi:shikimate kinase